MTKIFIVVLNWNGHKDTIDCLKGLSKISDKGFKKTLLVVDNASTDDSVQVIKKEYPLIKLIQNKENTGYSGGNNVGIRYALKNGADYVLVINNDTVVKGDFLEKMFLQAEKSEAGLVCPKIYFARGYEFHKNRYKKNELGRVFWSAGGNIDWENVYASNRGVDEVDNGQYEEGVEVDFAPGACVLMSAKLLKQVGMFDEKYFLYFEDTDLSERARRSGFKILYEPSAVIWHKVAGSSAIGSKLNDYFITRNRLLFGMRYAKIRARIALGRESFKMLLAGRPWQKRGVIDAYTGNFGKGSWQ